MRDPGAGLAPWPDLLARAGVVLEPLGEREPRGPGVLLFDRPTPAVHAFLRLASRGGVERVLAIATLPASLPEGEVWRLLRHGAAEVVAWDPSADRAAEVAARLARWAEVDRLVASPLVRQNLVGQSPAWTAVLRQVAEAARYTDSPILVTGESGTGKELLARLVHSLDPRTPKRELVILDCSTLVPELSGSEFFGHERGSFTGAAGPREGVFALADGGTLFLDEVGELSPRMQAQLLRVVQEGTYKRVGGNHWQRTRFRLICATNRDLLQEVNAGGFRADLYYRLASVTCRVPPLRDRMEDVLPLFRHFLAELLPGEEPPEPDPVVRAYLQRRRYPGNVRDLRQLATRIAYRHVGAGPITPGDLPEAERPDGEEDLMGDEWPDGAFEASIRRALAQGRGLKEIGRTAAEAAIRIVMGDEEGNLKRAAQRLGVTDRALQMRQAARRVQVPGEIVSDAGTEALDD